MSSMQTFIYMLSSGDLLIRVNITIIRLLVLLSVDSHTKKTKYTYRPVKHYLSVEDSSECLPAAAAMGNS